jgi:peptide deformylase
MSILPLVYYPSQLLKQKSEPIKEINDEIKRFVDDMAETMYHNKGAGLAAVQVGSLKRILILDLGKKHDPDSNDLRVFINPEITSYSEEKIIYTEGCLSFPGAYLEISRPKKVSVKYTNIQGKKEEIEADDWLSRGIQHEMDHLNGIVLYEYVSKIKADLFLKKVSKHMKTINIK